ncbi:MAG: glycosyl transferase [Betaproteobacteria bacterium]
MSSLPYSPWAAISIAAALSALALGVLESLRDRLPQDHPVERSLHVRPMLRVGGIAIWAGFLPVALVTPVPMAGGLAWLGAWGAVVAVSLADDWSGVRPAIRLGIQSVAAVAIAAVMGSGDGAQAFAMNNACFVAIAAFAFVWAANLYNFMDGSDGVAAWMALCGFAAYGAAALVAGERADLYFALSAATLPFLLVNIPPARAFMGDGGSVPLGFLAAVFGLAGIRAETWPAWFPLLVFLPFIADTLMTMFRRIAAGEDLFRAHKTHYYQRLHRLGAGHAGTLLFYGVLVVGTCTCAVFALAAEPAVGWRMLGAWTAAIGVLFAGIDYHWRKGSAGQR